MKKFTSYDWIVYRAQLPGGPPRIAQASFVELWYDKRERIWVSRTVDSDYNQIGEADYAFGCHGLKLAAAHANSVWNSSPADGRALKFETIN